MTRTGRGRGDNFSDTEEEPEHLENRWRMGLPLLHSGLAKDIVEGFVRARGLSVRPMHAAAEKQRRYVKMSHLASPRDLSAPAP